LRSNSSGQSLLQATASNRILLPFPGIHLPELLGDGSPQADLLKNFFQGNALVAPVEQAEDSEYDGVPGRDEEGLFRLYQVGEGFRLAGSRDSR